MNKIEEAVYAVLLVLLGALMYSWFQPQGNEILTSARDGLDFECIDGSTLRIVQGEFDITKDSQGFSKGLYIMAITNSDSDMEMTAIIGACGDAPDINIEMIREELRENTNII